jgi:hypothetical protein
VRAELSHFRLLMNDHDALDLARRAHEGQVDKAGEPYILHVQRVMARLSNPDEKVAAALHDVVRRPVDMVASEDVCQDVRMSPISRSGAIVVQPSARRPARTQWPRPA